MSGNNALGASVRRLGRSIRRVGRTHYPRFLFGLETSPGDIPIFIDHDVDPEIFTQDLTFLKENGYRTLTTDQFLAEQGNASVDRAVLLTFDDARRNFWEVAFPLLKKFDAHATLFVPTYWMGESKNDLDTIEVDNPARHQFMTWEQLRVCSQSGIVDVQSHAHRHALVYTARQLVDFVSPHILQQYHLYDLPMRWVGGTNRLGTHPLGSPVYESMPLLSAEHRILENESVVLACQKFVQDRGGTSFFSHKNWQKELRRVHDSAISRLGQPTHMVRSEFENLVRSEFVLTRQLFETELGVLPRFLAYPWMLGSEMSLAIAKETGFLSVFGVGLDFNRIRKLPSHISAFGRLKADWIRFLPGQGRLQLRDVIPKKIRGFLNAQHLAH